MFSGVLLHLNRYIPRTAFSQLEKSSPPERLYCPNICDSIQKGVGDKIFVLRTIVDEI